MKKLVLFLIASLLFTASLQAKMEFPAQPNPPRLVNDFSNILNDEELVSLERQLVAFSDSTGIQIAVVTLNDLNGYEIGEYAVGLLREWGIGGKKNNTGVLFLIAVNERKLYITTGYGMEGALPDGKLQLIINNEVKPQFKNKDYYQGIQNGVNSIIALSKGEYKETTVRNLRGKRTPIWLLVIIVILILVFIMRSNNGGGTSIHRGGFSDVANTLFLASLLNSGRSRGGDFGGWGGGGGDSGGFGGFGGGSGGGGGAGGSW